jgi:hypothetical protein
VTPLARDAGGTGGGPGRDCPATGGPGRGGGVAGIAAVTEPERAPCAGDCTDADGGTGTGADACAGIEGAALAPALVAASAR